MKLVPSYWKTNLDKSTSARAERNNQLALRQIVLTPVTKFLKNLAYAFARITGKPAWSVDFSERGRDGYVYYREPAFTITFYWEFGGGDTVAIITPEKEAKWRKDYPWASARRQEILQRVASEVVRQKAPSCRAEIDGKDGCIYVRQSGQRAVPFG